jgi:hypothetical protein
LLDEMRIQETDGWHVIALGPKIAAGGARQKRGAGVVFAVPASGPAWKDDVIAETTPDPFSMFRLNKTLPMIGHAIADPHFSIPTIS